MMERASLDDGTAVAFVTDRRQPGPFRPGRLRQDLVAFAGLIAACLIGAVPSDEVFSGFGQPAVAVIALVLIISRGLSRSGAIELLDRHLLHCNGIHRVIVMDPGSVPSDDV
jgi:di/tricarboxylate transporter